MKQLDKKKWKDANEYFINFVEDTSSTIDSFIDKYNDIFNKLGLNLSRSLTGDVDLTEIMDAYNSTIGDINYDPDLDSKNENSLTYETISGRKTYQIVVGDSWENLIDNYTKLTGKQPLPIHPNKPICFQSSGVNPDPCVLICKLILGHSDLIEFNSFNGSVCEHISP